MDTTAPRQAGVESRPLAGRTAIVTGSTSGIGLGIAHTLAASGAVVVLNGHGDSATIEDLRVAIEAEHHVTATYDPADMTSPDKIVRMVQDAERMFGALDVLVNNAGIQHTAAVEEFPPAMWDAILSINLSAAFHAIRAALPGMRRRGFGRIVNIASVHGLVGSQHKAAYVAAKHGLLGLTKVVALECARENITCNAICPGWVRTPLVEAQIADRAKAQGLDLEQATAALLGEKQPSMRFAEAREIGSLTMFLASDSGRSITGAALPVDGGWTAQ
jgi:3-hydroxybutyrate dehydrogenase